MSLPPDEAPLPPSLRVLKWLVILLTLSMIGAVITVVWLLVTRMPTAIGGAGTGLTAGPDLPEAVSLPPGETASAVTFGEGWIAVVTRSGRILVFGSDGRLRQEITLEPPSGAPPGP